MSQKREEYHDPDYGQFQPVYSQAESDTKKTTETKSDAKPNPFETRNEAIRRIIDREFQQELHNKEHEFEEINRRLDESKQLLAKVRYAIVYHYYNQKNLICSADEVAAVEKSQQECMTSFPTAGDKPQMAIHPSLKKLLGKRPIDYNEILKSRPARRAAQNAIEQFHKMSKKPTDTKIKMHDFIIDESPEQRPEVENKKPRYIAPLTSKQNEFEQVNSARGRNNYRHLLVVGNISKYIGDEEADLATSVTHKWLIYVSSKSCVPVEQIVSRARFFLHESYKPNDIIEVSSSPFQITKRGWGEFPVRVQLYFHSHLMQKPLQICHTLILDKKHTGMQTMGAETIVELWLNVPSTMNDEESVKASTRKNSSKPSTSKAFALPCKSLQPSISQDDEMSKVVSVKSEAVVKSEPTVKQEPLEAIEWQNGLSTVVPVTELARVPMKIEQPVAPITALPEQKICDQNIAHLADSKPILSTTLPALKNNSRKTFVKCVGKDGKISLMELVQDEKNPKLFKMVLPKANKVFAQQSQVSGAPILLPSNLIRPIAPMANIANLKLINIQNSPANRLISIASSSQPPVNLPKLVAINSPPPSNTVLNRSTTAPTITTTQRTASTLKPISVPLSMTASNPNLMQTSKLIPIANSISASKPTSVLIHKPSSNPVKSIIQKNNKVWMMDPSRLPKMNQQQSLLKPQVSLLRSRIITTNSNNVKKITVSDILGLEHNINVFVPTDVKLKPNAQMKKQPTTHQYGDELEKRFFARKSFENMTEAIGWLFKEIPLISSLAAQLDFRESFPFVVPTLTDFHNLLIPKQRSFEWLRAKYVNRLACRHQSLKEFSKWCTKDIVLFGRWFGYTPQSIPNRSSMSRKQTEQNVRDMIKSELIREHLQNDTISFNKKLTKWIEKIEKIVRNGLTESTHGEIICVDDEVEAEQAQKNSSPLKTNRNYLQLPIQRGHDEVMWINEICRKMQIRFGHEEIVEGVLHRSAELTFAVALRSFVADLLRKCAGNKQRKENSDSSNEAAELSTDDVLHTLTSIQYFDFLTNKNLGIEKPNPS